MNYYVRNTNMDKSVKIKAYISLAYLMIINDTVKFDCHN